MGSATIEVREVRSSSDLKTFISVPWSIYRDDPNWVPPLKIERKSALSSKNPFFLHARWKAWIAYLDGRAVGRISAQIDELYLQRHDAHTGFFGLLEASENPAVFAALFGGELAERTGNANRTGPVQSWNKSGNRMPGGRFRFTSLPDDGARQAILRGCYRKPGV